MSYGDEMGEGARILRLVPREPFTVTISVRECPECGDTTTEPGERCELCRIAQGCVSASFVQSTAADAIRKLERLDARAMPVRLHGPLAEALAEIRRVYDACEPLIHSLNVGVVHEEEGEFWALPHPFATAARLGPFGARAHAERALIEHAFIHGPTSEPTEDG